MQLLRWTFANTYCQYEGKHYQLDCGPIGLGVTGEVALVYMEEFQLKAISTSPIPINSWPWYVDDSAMKCKNNEAEKILEHLNIQEPGVIQFTKEEQKDNCLAVLDLKHIVNRRTKTIECTVNYKDTHTNINVKEKSNHPDTMKRAIIKGFADRPRALCDEKYLEEELQNITDVFVANGFNRTTVKEYMEENKIEKDVVEEEEESRGMVVVTYLKTFSEKFKRIAKKHRFKTAYKPGAKVKESKKLCQEPLGDKTTEIIYRIPCKCNASAYTGETRRTNEIRQYEHQMHVRLTHQDIANNNRESAEIRMNTGDGGLPRYSVNCEHDIDWEGVKILGIE